jgi:hypothetical protein
MLFNLEGFKNGSFPAIFLLLPKANELALAFVGDKDPCLKIPNFDRDFANLVVSSINPPRISVLDPRIELNPRDAVIPGICSIILIANGVLELIVPSDWSYSS